MTAIVEQTKAPDVRRGAYFVFAHFSASSIRQAIDWREASYEIARSLGIEHIPPAARAGGVVGWRFITENNRELARSLRLFRDETEARQDALRVRERAGELELHVVVTEQRRGAGWCGTIDESPILVSARRYENRSAARSAGELAMRLLSAAARDGSAPPRVTS